MAGRNGFRDIPQDESSSSSDEQGPELVQLIVEEGQGSDTENAEVENVAHIEGIRTPRPLDLADSFEVVRGVPAFVWRDSFLFKADYRVFAFSPDGTRMALMETDHRLKLYDVLDNFSVLAEAHVNFDTRVCCLCFGSTGNDEIIAVHEDSCVTPFSIRQSTIEPSQTCAPFVEHPAGCHESRFRMQFRDTHKLHFLVNTLGVETWICAYDMRSPTVINVNSSTQGQHPTARIRTPPDIVPVAAYVSIPQRALMMVGQIQDEPEMTKTLIWRDIDHESDFVDQHPPGIDGRGFGWSDCGNYFVIWKSTSLELYHGIEDVERSMQPMALTSISDEIHHLHCEFLTLSQVGIELCREPDPERVPIVAYLAASSKSLKLFFWDPVTNTIRRELDLTVRGMVLPHDAHCEFCLSPNLRWAAIGCWTSGRFGLFSLATGTWVWNLSLNASDLRRCPCELLRFDVSGTKLFVNAAGALHVFAPPCLVENQIIMESAAYDLTTPRREDGVEGLSQDHRRLIPKHILRRMLVGMGENHERRVVDVARSVKSSKVALLVREEAGAFILLGQFQNFFTPQFRDYSRNDFQIDLRPEDIELIDIYEDFRELRHNADRSQILIFLYPDVQPQGESIVVFTLGARFAALFLNGVVRHLISYHRLVDPAEWLSVNQSKDGMRAICMKEYGLAIIDLNTREILQSVPYKASISRWLSNLGHPWEETSVDVSDDGTSILVGFDVKRKKMVYLRKTMTAAAAAITLYNRPIATHCWALEQDFNKVAFLEFDPRNNTLSSIGVHNTKNNHTRIVRKEHWYPFVSRVLEDLNDNEVKNASSRQEKVWTYGLHLDEQTGHLWLTAITHPSRGSKLVLAPIGPHTIKNCLPYMDMLDYPPHHQVRLPEIERFVENFGMSYFYMPFNGTTNLDLMMGSDVLLMKWRLLSLGATYGISLDPKLREDLMDSPAANLLEVAIEERNELMAKFFLERIVQETCLSESNAALLKQCFDGLWTNFRTMITSVLDQNLVASDVCNVEILAEAFTSEEHLVTRLGTCDALSAWQDSAEEGLSFAYWWRLNRTTVHRILQRGNVTRVRGQLKVFGIADVCKIGLRGILRSLLMQRVPSHVFKTQLVKWVLIWKWENIWKRRCLRHVLAYTIYGTIFVLYTIFVGASTSTFSPISHYFSLDNLLLLVLILSSFYMLRREYCQLQTYIMDGKQLHPNDRLFGIKYYLRSRCNALEVITYLVSLVVIPVLHVLSCYSSSYLSVLYRLVVLIIFAICAKVWYYATSFQTTGALVLTVKSVIRYSLPFLALAGVIIVAFGISLFVLFAHLLEESEDTDENHLVRARIDVRFGTPFKSILTTFFAMLGNFDYEIFSDYYDSSPLITTTFVIYLIIQLIVILNMLVAVMSNTFDQVKDTEEDELCIGRARLIDAYEAMLSPQQIAKLDELSQKYLYVIYPLEEGYDDEPSALRGRPSTSEKHIGQLIKRSQDQITEDLRDSIGQANLRTDSRINEILQRLDALQE